MALVTNVVRVRKPNPKVHGPTTCECTTFEVDGLAYVQLNTFGSKARQERGETSQTIQLDVKAAEQLRDIIDEVFPRRSR
jgi:hypothetical protein